MFPNSQKNFQCAERQFGGLEERIDELRKLIEEITIERDANSTGNTKELTGRDLDIESLHDLKESIENDFQAVQVQWEDIVKAASRAKKSTGGGLCQLTPWHLKTTVVYFVWEQMC